MFYTPNLTAVEIPPHYICAAFPEPWFTNSGDNQQHRSANQEIPTNMLKGEVAPANNDQKREGFEQPPYRVFRFSPFLLQTQDWQLHASQRWNYKKQQAWYGKSWAVNNLILMQ